MYYIFIVNDFDLGDVYFTGKEIANTLLEKEIWVFNSSTTNLKKLMPKDKIIIYIAGRGNRYFYANFELIDDIKERKLIPSGKREEVLFGMFPLSCKINVLEIWPEPIYITDIKEDLNFITDKKNYGLFFRQSTKVISEEDYNLIINRK